MTRAEALKKGREIRQEKVFRALYEQNKHLINKNHYVSYDMFKRRVEKAWAFGGKEAQKGYGEVKSLVAAGRKMLHTLEYIDRETLAIENIKEGLKTMKTGRKITWGKPKFTGFVNGVPQYEQVEKEETMFDVFRRLTGVGKKFNLWWDENTQTYHFQGANGLEYEIIVKTSPVSYGIQLVNA